MSYFLECPPRCMRTREAELLAEAESLERTAREKRKQAEDLRGFNDEIFKVWKKPRVGE